MKNHDFVCTIWNFAVLISFSFVNKLYICECRNIPVYETGRYMLNISETLSYRFPLLEINGVYYP